MGYLCPICEKVSSNKEWNEKTKLRKLCHYPVTNIENKDIRSYRFWCPNCHSGVGGNEIIKL